MEEPRNENHNIQANANEDCKIDPRDINNYVLEDDDYERILEDKEKHLDILSLPATYEKALCHYKATQFYQKDCFENQESKKLYYSSRYFILR